MFAQTIKRVFSRQSHRLQQPGPGWWVPGPCHVHACLDKMGEGNRTGGVWGRRKLLVPTDAGGAGDVCRGVRVSAVLTQVRQVHTARSATSTSHFNRPLYPPSPPSATNEDPALSATSISHPRHPSAVHCIHQHLQLPTKTRHHPQHL